jgi:hypothetical protein
MNKTGDSTIETLKVLNTYRKQLETTIEEGLVVFYSETGTFVLPMSAVTRMQLEQEIRDISIKINVMIDLLQ